MLSEEIKENIKRHYGSSDEDLADLGAVMDALQDMDKIEDLKRKLETQQLESEKKLSDLDKSWRDRYRERFFDGDVSIPDIADLEDESDARQPEDISIEEYIAKIEKEERK